MYFRSVFVWFVVGGFFGDGLYFAISKIYESRFNGYHTQSSYQLTFASNPPCAAFPTSTFMPCNLAIRRTIDSPSPLPVAVCPGGREKRSPIRARASGVTPGPLSLTLKLSAFSVTSITLPCG